MSEQAALDALQNLVEGVEASGGIWICYDEDRQEIGVCVRGPGGLLDSRVADAYILACQYLGRPIVAEPESGSDHFEPEQVSDLVKLPRSR